MQPGAHRVGLGDGGRGVGGDSDGRGVVGEDAEVEAEEVSGDERHNESGGGRRIQRMMGTVRDAITDVGWRWWAVPFQNNAGDGG